MAAANAAVTALIRPFGAPSPRGRHWDGRVSPLQQPVLSSATSAPSLRGLAKIFDFRLGECPIVRTKLLLRCPAAVTPDKAGLLPADRCHSLRSLLPPPAALPSLPLRLRLRRSHLPQRGRQGVALEIPTSHLKMLLGMTVRADSKSAPTKEDPPPDGGGCFDKA